MWERSLCQISLRLFVGETRRSVTTATVIHVRSEFARVILVGDSYPKRFGNADTGGNAGQPYHQRRCDFCT